MSHVKYTQESLNFSCEYCYAVHFADELVHFSNEENFVSAVFPYDELSMGRPDF